MSPRRAQTARAAAAAHTTEIWLNRTTTRGNLPPMPTVLRLRNHIDELPRAQDEASRFLEAHGAGGEVVFAASLAIEELFTNIVKYGYDDSGEHEVELTLDVCDGTARIELADDGHEFNPFDQPEPDTSLPAEEREIGGLGIHFVRNMLDSCHYERRDGRNIVTVTKNL